MHAGLAKEVALKVLFEDSADDADQIARFQRESRVLARLSHPGIVEVYDCGSEGPVHYFAMALLEDRTLTGLLEIHSAAGGWLPEPQCVTIVSSILEVLAVVHAENIIHRDIKPSNIFVTGEDQAIVSDFGLVKVVDETSLTLSPDAVLGTIAYMAPEQILSEPADARTDLYAVGLVLYRMLYGQLPFGEQMAEVVQKKTLHAGFKPPAKPPREISPGLADVLIRACRRDRRERFASAEEFLAALERLSLSPKISSRKLQMMAPKPKPAAPRATRQTAVAAAIAPAAPAAAGPTAGVRRPRRFRVGLRALAIVGLALSASVVVGLLVRFAMTSGVVLTVPTGAPSSTPGPVATPPDARLLLEAQGVCRDVYTLLGSECYKVFIASVLAPDVERLRACYGEELEKLSALDARLNAVLPALEKHAGSSLAARSWLASTTLYGFLLGARRRGLGATHAALAMHRSGTLSQEELARMQPQMGTDEKSQAFLPKHAELVRELAREMARAPEKVEAEAGRLIEDVRALARMVGLLAWTPESAAAARDHLRLLPEVVSRAPAPVGPALSAALSSVRTVALHSGRGELSRAMVRAAIEDLAGLRAVLPLSHAGLAPVIGEAWRDLDRSRP